MNDYERSVKVFQQKEEWTGGHFQGDILLNQDETLPQVSCLNAVCSKNQLWPEATLYYCIMEKFYKPDQIQQILDAATEIHNTMNCVKLFRVPEKSKENYLEIKPFLQGKPSATGCSSYVGMMGGCQELCLDSKSLFNIGTIMHEFLHALGLHHEHIREDRDSYITIHWDNIHGDNWKHFSKVDNTLISNYDYQSLLHPCAKVFALDSRKDTITAKKANHTIGRRDKLSEMDIEKLQVLYGCKKPQETQHFHTFNEKDMFKKAEWIHKEPPPRKPEEKNNDTQEQSSKKA